MENPIGESDVNCTKSDREQSADAFAADAETAVSTTAVPFKLAWKSFVHLLIVFIYSIYCVYNCTAPPVNDLAPPQHLH